MDRVFKVNDSLPKHFFAQTGLTETAVHRLVKGTVSVSSCLSSFLVSSGLLPIWALHTLVEDRVIRGMKLSRNWGKFWSIFSSWSCFCFCWLSEFRLTSPLNYWCLLLNHLRSSLLWPAVKPIKDRLWNHLQTFSLIHQIFRKRLSTDLMINWIRSRCKRLNSRTLNFLLLKFLNKPSKEAFISPISDQSNRLQVVHKRSNSRVQVS